MVGVNYLGRCPWNARGWSRVGGGVYSGDRQSAATSRDPRDQDGSANARHMRHPAGPWGSCERRGADTRPAHRLLGATRGKPCALPPAIATPLAVVQRANYRALHVARSIAIASGREQGVPACRAARPGRPGDAYASRCTSRKSWQSQLLTQEDHFAHQRAGQPSASTGQLSHNAAAFTQSPCGRPSWTLRLIRRRRAKRRNYRSSHVICVARRAGAQGPRRRPRGRPPGPWWVAGHRGTPSVPSGNPHEGAPSFRISAVVPLPSVAPRRGNAPRRAPSYRFPTVPDGAPPLLVVSGAGPVGST